MTIFELEKTIGTPKKTQGAFDTDDGLLIVKSGTDFEEMSQLAITVVDGGKERKKVIKSVKVIRHCDPGTHNDSAGTQNVRKYRMPEVMNRIFKNQVRG